VRLALGATRRQVLGAVVRSTRLPLLGGLCAGLLLSIGAGRVLKSSLLGLSPLDPLSYAGAVAILFGVAVLAVLIPARRAAAVDPVISLKAE
jgi:ABC-type antimicrobial peptide transport system permease subunit